MRRRAGLALHTAGWPLDTSTYGGSFLYHMQDNLVAVGFEHAYDKQWWAPAPPE